MLKNILFHLDEDDIRQSRLEQAAADNIQNLQRINLNAFQRSIPGVYQQLTKSETHSAAIFCNKHGELNIVDHKNARVLYGEMPQQEVATQCAQFLERPLRVPLGEERSKGDCADPVIDSSLARKMSEAKLLPEKVSVMVVLGVGLGFHIKALLESVDIEHLIIYEPNTAYFRCSVLATSWQDCLHIAREKQTGIYLQLGKDARDLAADIDELSQNVSFDHFYLYKHYHHPVFNQLVDAVAGKSWETFSRWALNIKQLDNVDDQVPFWTYPVQLPEWSSGNLDQQRFEKNLESLKNYFPDLYSEFCDYSPKKWVPLANNDGDVNIFHTKTVAPLYGPDPDEECKASIDGFSVRPNKDGLVLGYKGRKLKRYFHYQLVEDVEDVLDGLQESHGSLPETIKSMIIFGLGVGYQLPYLLANHDVQKLFICEPNRDYFYASLFAVDWQDVFETVDQSGGRLYINIGDDGRHLLNDLLTQFHSIGPYVLANTYFYQGYYNPMLVNAIAQLREQLQVIIAMGDYFDHSKLSIAHTLWGIEQKIPFLRRDGASLLSQEQKDVPVFIVGNGPSLDGLLDTIKENQDSAIIISCGTSLQTLHRNGIVPDFHAEIEINRSTYDWAMRVGAPEFLKQTTLISCNGIHPDTCRLYKNTLLAFKQGESATVSITELFKGHPYETLDFAYPTVSNFVCDLVTTLGFTQLYLMGVDMGFVDDDYHHSKSSGYYFENGKQRYDYAKANDTSLLVEGNLRPFVKTKFEFKVSKTVLEQTFSGRHVEVYNLNDGAKIAGALPLMKDDILIMSDPQVKSDALETLNTKAFTAFDLDEFTEQYQQRYRHDALVEELDAFIPQIAEDVTTREQADKLVSRQRDFLVSSFMRKKSLLFYYLNGTVNFVNSALSKTLNVDDDATCLAAFNDILEKWRESFGILSTCLTLDHRGFDYVPSFIRQRQREALLLTSKQHPMAFSFPDELTKQRFNTMLKGYSLTLSECDSVPQDSVEMRFVSSSTVLPEISTHKRCLITSDLDMPVPETSTDIVICLPGNAENDGTSPVCNDFYRLYVALMVAVCSEKIRYVWPRISLDPKQQSIGEYYNIERVSGLYAYECYDFICFTNELMTSDEMLIGSGDRLRFLPKLRERDLFLGELSLERQAEEKQLLKEQFPIIKEKSHDAI